MRESFTRATQQAYERWAPLYPPIAHNPLMRVEQAAMLELMPEVSGRRVLDLACGTGRYSRVLAAAGATEVVAVDFCEPMVHEVSGGARVCASMMEMPFADSVFDLIVSGLALGHATDVGAWMIETSRVLRDGGDLLYSDFHPAASLAGLPRSFKDENNRLWEVPHRCYPVDLQKRAAGAAGLCIDTVREIRVGFELREPFAKSDEFYRRWHGLPIALIVRAHK